MKYRKSLLNKKVEKTIIDSFNDFKERYAIEISHIGFDQNHIHILARFLPKYSGGQVIKVIKRISTRHVFKNAPEVKKELWGDEFWADGYYIAIVSGRGNKWTIENYIKKQDRRDDVKQLKLFEIR